MSPCPSPPLRTALRLVKRQSVSVHQPLLGEPKRYRASLETLAP
jgi:hypothetical protein